MSQYVSTPVEIPQSIPEQIPLPKDWRLVRLGELGRIVSGGTPSRANAKSFTGSIPWVKTLDLNCGVVTETQECVSESALKEIRGELLPVGTVMVAMYGGAGTIGKSGILGLPACTNQAVCSLLPNPAVFVPEFLHFWLVFIRPLWMKYSGGNRKDPNINKSAVEQMMCPLPSLAEQQHIASILNKQIAAVEQARTAAEAQLKTAKDLPAANMRAVFNSPEANEWDRKKLSEVCEIVARQVDPKIPEYGALPHVNGENIESGTCRLKFLHTATEDKMTSGKYLFEVGDVLYSKLRPYLRKVLVADFRGVCSADMYPIRVNPEFLSPRFTGWLLVSDEFTKYADEESRRARMPKLNREQLFAWEAPLPPLDKQGLIIESLSEQMAKAESLVSKLQTQLDSINKLPTALLRQAFTGKL